MNTELFAKTVEYLQKHPDDNRPFNYNEVINTWNHSDVLRHANEENNNIYDASMLQAEAALEAALVLLRCDTLKALKALAVAYGWM